MNNITRVKQLVFELKQELNYINKDMLLVDPESYKDESILLNLIDIATFIDLEIYPIIDDIADTCYSLLDDMEPIDHDQD